MSHKKSFLILLILFGNILFATTFAANENNATKSVLNIQHWQSKNGAAVYFVYMPKVPILDMQLIFRAGSVYDGKNLGLAAFVNSMIGESTSDLNATQIADAFDNIGAIFNSGVDRDKATISLRSLTDVKYLDPALKIFSDVVGKTTFPKNAFQRVKNQITTAIEDGQQDPQTVALNAFFKAIYNGQAYANPVFGTIESVNNITKQQAENFYKNFYVVKNASIILVGNISREKAAEIADQVLKQLPQGNAAPKLSMDNSAVKPDIVHVSFPAAQTSIMLGQLGVASNEPDYFPLMLGNYIYGGLPLRSILFQEVRLQRGMAYYAGSSFLTLQYRGPFEIILQTEAKQAPDALQLVQNSFDDFIKQGPTEAQLIAAKKYVIGSFPFKIDSNSDILSTVTDIVFYERPLNFLDNYVVSVNAVTTEQIKAAFAKKLNPKNMVVVMVGPGN